MWWRVAQAVGTHSPVPVAARPRRTVVTATYQPSLNGHSLPGSMRLPANVVGPVERLQHPPTIPVEAVPDPAPLLAPQPVEPVTEHHETVPSRPESPRPEPPVSIEAQMRRDGFTEPRGPNSPGSEVSFPLRKATKVGFGMTVAAAAVGQVMFFASFFGGTVWGYLGAAAIAAFAEVTMVGAGDSALRHKVEGNRGWQMLLAVSGAIAAGATVMQIAHWWSENVVMALTFGVASIAGWAVHIASGLIEANGYLRKRESWDAELARRQRKRESRDDVEYERRRADEENARQAAHRARVTAEMNLPASAPPPLSTISPAAAKPATKKSPRARAVPEPGEQATKQVAIDLGVRLGANTPSRLKAALTEAGYVLPRSSTTVENWCRDIKQLQGNVGRS
ncbi:hypothetical protein [Prauserella endophytica]|uniref:DUF2637 domain-containing protein n=1 Tax=Prauserella endophytica TaxID=1592324 RepID=A0ABY2RV01_9PSEU|nr:hypothetical protein [Prauserella endophytica]TKG61563.1 hypothetical protein FCN18_33535 [Prauserella endophytica]